MIDLLAYLGISAGWNFVFKPILEDLVKDSAKDFAKDFCKDSLKDVFHRKDEWSKATAKALKEFLQQFEEELIGAGETDETVKCYLDSLSRFVKIQSIREVLGSAITESDKMVDFALLAQTWEKEKLERLPNDFDWGKLCRRYQNKARAILRDSAEIRAILDSVHRQTTAKAVERLAGLPADFDMAKYAEGLCKRFGYLKLESLDPNPDHQRIALTKVFVEQNVRSCQQFNPRAYELPMEYRRKLRETGGIASDLEEKEIQRQRKAFLQQAPRNVLELVNSADHRLCVVLGDPGCGKSALLDYLALRWAESSSVERANQPVPLLIELKTYAENLDKGRCRDFLEYFDRGSGTVGHLDQTVLDNLLQRGQATLLLDGLDEIFDAPTRQQVSQDLVSFTIKYSLARFLVTSRVIGYDLVAPTLRDGGFQQFLVQELNNAQQESFISRWHKLAYADLNERTEKSSRLLDSIRNVSAIGELAQNPLLLTLMALLNRHQELPRDRNELYEQASKLMLQQWDSSKALREVGLLKDQSFDYKDKQAMLRAVAFRMQLGPEGLAGNVIGAVDLERTLVAWLEAERCAEPRRVALRLIEQLRERSFILCLLGDEYFAFVHRTFLEFFCAWAWVWKFEKGEKGKRIAFEELERLTFGSHWSDEKWQEVLPLIAARLEPQLAWRLIAGLLGKQDLAARYESSALAARCFSDMRNPGSLGPLPRKLEEELKSLARHPVPFEQRDHTQCEAITRAIQSVALCWPKLKSTKSWLNECARSTDTTVAIAALQELVRSWKDDPETLPLLKELARVGKPHWVRSAALGELAQGWKDDPEILPMLKEVARADKEFGARKAALQELAKGWKHDPETLAMLKEIARSDKEWGFREIALRELANAWKDDPETLPILKVCARTDESSEVRKTAVEQLALGWKNDPDTLPILKERAQADKSESVRGATVLELAKVWKDDPDTLPVLKVCAGSDEDTYVRATAVHKVARGWRSNPSILPWLKERARSDEDTNVRLTALQELAWGWKDDPDTLLILKERAHSDEDTNVRLVAVDELARGWKSNPTILSWLKDLARSDEDPLVRAGVVQELARGWTDDPEVQSLSAEFGLKS